MSFSSVSISARSFHRIGQTGLVGAFVFGLTIVAWAAWNLPGITPFIPIVLLTGIGLWFLFQKPLLNLAVVLSLFVLIADYEPGFNIQEILYGLYFLGFLAQWYFQRLILYKENIFERSDERVLVIFLVLVTLTLPLTILFDGSITGYISEWLSFSFLAFYFPIKEAIARDRRAIPVLAGAIALVGLYVLVRNVVTFQSVVTNAEYAFEVARGRAVTNEALLLVPAIVALTIALFQTKWLNRIFFGSLFLLFFGGVLLTQSRGYWIAFLFGIVVMLFVIPRRQKLTLGVLGVLTLSGVLGIGILLFGDAILLLVYGIAERFLSILSASSKDISLVNRFMESVGVWHYIQDNPILGYGMGVEYRVYDIIDDVTFIKTFIHNGYIALWYKFGIWGLGMMLFFLGSITRRAYLTFRSNGTPSLYRIISGAMLFSFSALFVSAMTSNPFYINDTMFIYGVLAGVVGGCASHLRTEKAALK